MGRKRLLAFRPSSYPNPTLGVYFPLYFIMCNLFDILPVVGGYAVIYFSADVAPVATDEPAFWKVCFY